MAGTRYSKTRQAQAQHTACTKLTWEDKQALHWMAVERGLSDYEMTRKILLEYVRGTGNNTEVQSPRT